mmetsp:Transcript_11631/g.28196  ORF Transcript_11631/g.28196 Transcript_11631/m.28196 type:complete len:87 (-) Transcript_11631:130-390(-)
MCTRYTFAQLFPRFECKSGEKKKTIARRRMGHNGARALLRIGGRKLADVVDDDVMHTVACSTTMLAPPHGAAVARSSPWGRRVSFL